MKSRISNILAVVLTVCAACVSLAAPRRTARVSLMLIDEASGSPVPGVVRAQHLGEDGDPIALAGLSSRGQGLDPKAPISHWYAVPGRATLELPRAQLRLEALSGLETERTVVALDLSDQSPAELRIPLRRFSKLREGGWYAANTHLHLRDLSRAEADRYLRELPAADGLDLLFVSHLERAGDDASYITNEYPIGRLKQLESARVQVANGEEHRHNFGAQGEGYGHVMLLGIHELVQPVSIGAGISGKHPDAPAMARGIDRAHEQGGTAIWCHNDWGYEDVPNWLAGRLDAQNIFDGGNHGGYADSFYHYLNAGLRVPFSTGTDWFLYDFARAYARVRGEPSPQSWLEALRAGRTFISNGPLLELRVQGPPAAGPARGLVTGAEPGETIALDRPGELVVESTARGRLDFGRFELIANGRVIASEPTRSVADHFEARLRSKLPVTEPCWLAVRINTAAQNEYGQPLFAHSSAVYVTVAGQTVRINEDVRFLLRELESARSAIAARAHFETDAQRTDILEPYDRAMARLKPTARE